MNRLSLLLAAPLLLVSCARTPSSPEIPDNSTTLRTATVTSRAVVPTGIVEMGSPETRFNDWLQNPEAEKVRLDLLASYGVNQIYWSVLNTDGNPDITLDDNTAPKMRKYAEAIAERGMRSHILVTERETWPVLQNDQRRAYHFRQIASIVAGLPAVVCIGEEISPAAPIRKWVAELRAALDAQGSHATPISIHNWPTEQPWYDSRGLIAGIDLIAHQTSSASEFGRIATLALPAYNSEWGGDNAARGIPSDNDRFNGVTGLEWARTYWNVGASSMRNAGKQHLGCGLYSGYEQDGCTDLGCIMPQKHEQALRLWSGLALKEQDTNNDGVIDAADMIGGR